MGVSQAITTPQDIQERYAAYYGLDEDVSPQIPMVGALGWNGAAWEKLETDGAGKLKVTE